MRSFLVVSLVLGACSSATEGDTERAPEPAASQTEPEQEPTPEPTPTCHDVSLRRAKCGDLDAECTDKTLSERSCAAGCPTAEFCVVEIASGDLYTMSCGWELEGVEGRLRACDDEQTRRWRDEE